MSQPSKEVLKSLKLAPSQRAAPQDCWECFLTFVNLVVLDPFRSWCDSYSVGSQNSQDNTLLRMWSWSSLQQILILIHFSSVDLFVQYVSSTQTDYFHVLLFCVTIYALYFLICCNTNSPLELTNCCESIRIKLQIVQTTFDTQKMDCSVLYPFEDPSAQKCVFHILSQH